MAKSLQEQLLNSGLVNSKQAKKAKSDKHKQQQQKNKQAKSKRGAEDENKKLVRQHQGEKKKKDTELNQQREAAAESKAIQAQIKQLIEMNVVSKEGGDVAFNFTDGKKVKKIYVTSTLQEQLSRGRLTIVSAGDDEKRYELIPTAVAEKIKLRDDSCIVFVGESKVDECDEDDPYADYQIPDDLMW